MRDLLKRVLLAGFAVVLAVCLEGQELCAQKPVSPLEGEILDSEGGELEDEETEQGNLWQEDTETSGQTVSGENGTETRENPGTVKSEDKGAKNGAEGSNAADVSEGGDSIDPGDTSEKDPAEPEEEPEPVVLEKPVIEKGEIQSGGIGISWSEVEGADGYYIHRKISGKDWEQIDVVPGGKAVSYKDAGVKSGTTYYYRIEAFCSDGDIVSGRSGYKKMVYLLAPVIRAEIGSAGNQIFWDKAAGAGGYYVYRRESSVSSWTKLATLTSGSIRSYYDKKAANGKNYVYAVRAYKEDSVSLYSAGKSIYRLSPPKVKSWRRKSSTKMTLKWSVNSQAGGYEIQYARNRLFLGRKTVTVKSKNTTSKTLSKLAKKKTYYARIRAYRVLDGKKYYSDWSSVSSVKKTKKASVARVKKKKKDFEIRGQAKQALYQYDTVQGSCTDGTYGYYILYNRKVSDCKIAKVKLSNMKVVKVSGVLPVAHGNDMTYNSSKKRLIVVHSTGKAKRLSVVNPQTLKLETSKDVKIPSKLSGASSSDVKGMTAFTGISYNSKRKQYAVLLSKTYNILVLDSEMEPVSLIKTTKKNNYTFQGIDTTDDHILLAQSPKGKNKYNIISVYDWEGKYISKIQLMKGYEIESLYHVGSKYYASFYRSYNKTYYKTKKKVVKVKGKKKVKKVRVKCKKVMRDNYIYRITGF